MHEHIWNPIPLHIREYSCECGATSFKSEKFGYLIHKKKKIYKEITVNTSYAEKNKKYSCKTWRRRLDTWKSILKADAGNVYPLFGEAIVTTAKFIGIKNNVDPARHSRSHHSNVQYF